MSSQCVILEYFGHAVICCILLFKAVHLRIEFFSLFFFFFVILSPLVSNNLS